jgi:arginyl-tRNA--protein-N-Asp/Glu arginylyltransferase
LLNIEASLPQIIFSEPDFLKYDCMRCQYIYCQEMKLLQQPSLSAENPCPYLDGRVCRFSYFFAHQLDGHELEELLSHGWRKFGLYYFSPQCRCGECIAVRVLAQKYIPSKEHRRILRKNEDVEVCFRDLEYRDEIYDIYKEHSLERFGKIADKRETFIDSFFMPSCPSKLSEFYLDGNLVAVGFVDLSDRALSSVYFIYRTSVTNRRMGTFGMIQEIEYARKSGLEFYYPGYYIKDNARMSYKGRFHPAQYYDWQEQDWHDEGIDE